MKGLVISLSVTLGIIFGMFPSISKPKPNWWKVTVAILFVINLVMIFSPILITNLNYANYLAEAGATSELIVNPDEGKLERNGDTLNLAPLEFPIVISSSKTQLNNKFLKIQYSPSEKVFKLLGTENYSVLPLTYPYINELKERIKIMVLHVPVAWTAVLAYLFSMIFAVMYLKKRDFKYDMYAVSSAGVGIVLTILATVTGMIWAKFNWGSYWNWDPRETSIFILLLIYFAYFALRHSVENPDTRSRLSAVYSIIAFVTVPFFVFILPRISSGLHPGAAGENTSGPVIGAGTEMLNPNLLITFGFSMFCFTLLFFWIFNLKIRAEKVYNK